MKVVVFDLGGTLMQYAGMPCSWVDFYHQGFEAIIKKYGCNISAEAIRKSIEILKAFNPRVSYREVEYTPEYIFSKVLEHWHITEPICDLIDIFWSSLELKAEIYPDTVNALRKLKEKGYKIATLTDLPCAMPDKLFKEDILELLDYFDYYVSSAKAGFRTPNPQGLKMISEKFSVSISDLIFVGDEEKDMQTAKNAKCKFIPIDRSKVTDKSISNLYELLDIL